MEILEDSPPNSHSHCERDFSGILQVGWFKSPGISVDFYLLLFQLYSTVCLQRAVYFMGNSLDFSRVV